MIGISVKHGKFLYHLINFTRPAQVVELGTGAGISTTYLSAAAYPAPLITVEGDPHRIAFARSQHPGGIPGNVTYQNIDFDDFIRDPGKIRKPFIAFIDGNHRLEPSLRYFKYFLSEADENSVLVFDDIRWSSQMQEAWEKIKAHPKVKISIDIFFMGIVFFKNGIAKQHFTIKF